MTFELSGVLLAPADLLAVGIDSIDDLPDGLDQAFGGSLSAALTDEPFSPEAGKTFPVRAMGRVEAKWVVVVGTGSGSVEDIRRAAGAVGHFARSKGCASLRIGLTGGPEHTTAAVEALVTGNYRYDRNLAEADRKAPMESVALVGSIANDADLERGRTLGAARGFARDLVNGPAAEIYPETLAQAAVDLATARLSVEVWGDERIDSAGMGGLGAVGQGSDRPPRFVHMVYEPTGAPTAEVAIVGKGVTFDAGGLSIKPTSGMETMRCDMGGAAAVIGAMSALGALDVKARVHGIFGAAENLLSGSSYKLGDILTMHNGKTVEVLNTDAEGRLILADCLSYASALEDVTHIVDLATLTGAAVVALGEHYTALYANDEAFRDTLNEAARRGGEAFWPMPLEPLYDELIKGSWGQIKNVGGRWGGSITAALFLQNFVAEGKTWSHLDIAGPAFISKAEGHLEKGATGAGVPALLAWLSSL